MLSGGSDAAVIPIGKSSGTAADQIVFFSVNRLMLKRSDGDSRYVDVLLTFAIS